MKPAVKRTLLVTTLACSAGLGIAMMFVGSGTKGTAWQTDTTQPPATDTSYTVDLSPAGKVRFEKIPERVVTMDANYNDMLVAVRQEQKLIATGYKDNFHDEFYREVPGLTVRYDPAHLTYLSAPGGSMFDKELLYSLHADVHHIDPVQLASSRGWTRADVDEVARNVAPFVANRFSRENNHSGPDPYAYYTVWELSEKIAEVYRRPETIRQLKDVYDGMLSSIHGKLPPEGQRPRVGLVYYGNSKFTTYSLANAGFGQAQYRDVGARDAFATIADRSYGGSAGGPTGTPLDAEGLLALDPEVLIMPFALQTGAAATAFQQMQGLKGDPLLGKVKAFQNDRIYPGGTPLQGPLFYLFQIEMAAKQIYPEIFGTFRMDLAYPPAEQLFDRARVARILDQSNGSH